MTATAPAPSALTDAERALWKQAQQDYKQAVAISAAIWEERENVDVGTPPEVIQAGAATVLIHVTQLRRDQGRTQHASPASPTNGTPANAPASDVPACPVCGGRMMDNRPSKKNPKEPDFRCFDDDCRKDGVHTTGVWLDKPKGGRR